MGNSNVTGRRFSIFLVVTVLAIFRMFLMCGIKESIFCLRVHSKCERKKCETQFLFSAAEATENWNEFVEFWSDDNRNSFAFRTRQQNEAKSKIYAKHFLHIHSAFGTHTPRLIRTETLSVCLKRMLSVLFVSCLRAFVLFSVHFAVFHISIICSATMLYRCRHASVWSVCVCAVRRLDGNWKVFCRFSPNSELQ